MYVLDEMSRQERENIKIGWDFEKGEDIIRGNQ
jgi:hypothetical protein